MNVKYLTKIKQISLDNKYTRWYIDICLSALNRTPKTTKIKTKKFAKNLLGYVEGHHILPRSLCVSKNEINDFANIVYLTAKEHFICHWLLTKMFDGHNRYLMKYALSAMSMYIKNRQLSALEYSKVMQAKKENGFPQTAHINATKTNKGRKQSKKHKKLNSEALKKLKWFNDGKTNFRLDATISDTDHLIPGRLCFRAPKRGPLSEETKRKLSQALSGKNNPRYNLNFSNDKTKQIETFNKLVFNASYFNNRPEKLIDIILHLKYKFKKGDSINKIHEESGISYSTVSKYIKLDLSNFYDFM